MPNTTQTAYDVANGAHSWAAVGAQWIVGSVDCYHCEGPVYVNWHTGASKSESAFLEAPPARDLDDPALGVQRGPFVLQPPDAYRSGLTVTKGSHSLLLSSCLYVCGQPVAVGSDRYAWTEGRGLGNRTLHGYVPRTRRRFTWTIPRNVPGAVAEIVLTNDRISAIVFPPLSGGSTDYSVRRVGRVVTARWPR